MARRQRPRTPATSMELGRKRELFSAIEEYDSFDIAAIESPALPIDLVELKLWPPRQGERRERFPIWTELRIADEVIATENWRITVHLTRAELAATFDGCAPIPGTRYGDAALPPTEAVVETEVDGKETVNSGEGSIKLVASLVKGLLATADMKVRKKVGSHEKKQTSRRSKINRRRVSTLPNDRWEIKEPNGSGRLHGTYLTVPQMEADNEKPLCHLQAVADRFEIALSVEARPHDLDCEISPIEPTKWTRSYDKPNNVKIAKLLVTKACTERFERPSDERVTLARMVLKGARKPQLR